MDYAEICRIALNQGLNGKVFVKDGPEFKNSINFGKLFKTLDGWDRKQWQKIYVTINKWTLPIKKTHIKPQLIPSKSGKNNVDTNICILDEHKTNENDPDTNLDIIDEFCVITNTSKGIAIPFLKAAKFNIAVAVNRYYSVNGDISQLSVNDSSYIVNTANNTYKNDDNDMKSPKDTTNHIDTESDLDIINQFCVITSATKKVAVVFLKVADWNISVAVNRYFSVNGDISKLSVNDNTDKNSDNDVKSPKDITNHIDTETDIDIVNQFCIMTNATKNVAVAFLKVAQWNISIAVNRYFSVNGDISQLDGINNYNVSNTDDTDKNSLVYSHGISFWYWHKQKENKRYIKSKYSDLKEEIIQFRDFSSKQWYELVEECKILKKTDKIKSISSNGNNIDIYNIAKSSSITVQHLCSIKLYTDYTWLCAIFCEAFRLRKISDTDYERVESVQTRNGKIANWARLLIESVQSYGKVLTNNKMRYYRGIGMEFIFKKFITKFNVPMSTTTNFLNATNFTQLGQGLILELKRYNEVLSGLECSPLSTFDHEKEVLFFGSNAILQISCVYQIYKNKWTNYRRYIQGIQYVSNIANGSIKWEPSNNMRDIISFILPHLYFDNIQLPPYIISLLNYHLTHLPRKIEYDFQELSHQYSWVQHIFVKKVKEQNIPNVSNACNLFKQCHHISFIMSNDYIMTADCVKSIIDDLLNISSNNIAIEFKWNVPRSLNHVQALFSKYAQKTDIDKSKNSITILHKKSFTRKIKDVDVVFNKPKSTYFGKIKNVEWRTKAMLYGFIRRIEKYLENQTQIPSDIINIIFMYFYVAFDFDVIPKNNSCGTKTVWDKIGFHNDSDDDDEDEDEEELVVVLTMDSECIYVGVAGDDMPQLAVPNIISIGNIGKNTVIGHQLNDDTFNLRAPIRPFQFGEITDFDALKQLLLKILSKTKNEIKGLIVSDCIPFSSREDITKFAFEELQCTKFALETRCVLSLYAAGRTSGISVYSDYECTEIMPVVNVTAIKSAAKKINFGKNDVIAYLQELKHNKLDQDEDIMSDAAMELFVDKFNIHKEISECISECNEIEIVDTEQTIKEVLYGNILLGGINVLYKGLSDILKTEICEINPNVETEIVKVIAPSDAAYSAWIGGSILGSLSLFDDACVTKEEYDEKGPSAVHKCDNTGRIILDLM